VPPGPWRVAARASRVGPEPPPPLPGSYHPFSTFGAKGAVFWLDEDGTLVDPQVLQKIEAALNRDY